MSRDERDAPETSPPSARGEGEERAREPIAGEKAARKKGKKKKAGKNAASEHRASSSENEPEGEPGASDSESEPADEPGVSESELEGESAEGSSESEPESEPGASPSATKASRQSENRSVPSRKSARALKVPTPPFAENYPDDAELRALLLAFHAGDYGYVRREAPALAERTSDPSVARAARDLRARLDPDRLTLGIFVGTGLLLTLLAVWAYGQH
jgi:hypothetical protein